VNTAALKAFAPAVRRDLMVAVGRKLDVVLAAQSPDYRSTYAKQVAELRALASADRDALVERVAYTWFNRLTALRYLDAKGWHPFRARVLTAATDQESQPELLRLTRESSMPAELERHTNLARLNELLDGRIPSTDPRGEVYRHLVLAACRYYHALLPDLFEQLDDATELLLPDDSLTEHSVVQGFRTEITDDDCTDVELLGWLYQFYIAEKKDAVMARKSAVPTEDLPAVTQLFTPHWIVRYLVENSLGRLWLLNRPGSRLREHMPYYIEGEPETDFLKITTPEEIKVCDPAVGSGHMLTYAFDLLSLIYEEEGYAPTEIPALILRHNLFGLEICPRAAQLAELALVFKAREKSRRVFQPGQPVRPHIIELRDVRFTEAELGEYVRELDLGALFNEGLIELLHQFEEAKTFGSLIQPCLDARAIADVRRAIEAKDLGGQLFLRETQSKVLCVLDQAEALTQRYHVVVANPPYMGGENMDASLKDFFAQQLPSSRANLYAGFIERCASLVQRRGLCAMITMHNWMFLTSFAEFRAWFLHQALLHSLLHLGARSFDSISGEVVQTAAFVFIGGVTSKAKAIFFRLTDGMSETEKEEHFLSRLSTREFSATASADFDAIPGSPVAYWLNHNVLQLFRKGKSLGDVSVAREGLSTGNNEKHVRFWPEVEFGSCGFAMSNRTAAQSSGCRWFPYNKGGPLRRWYGNAEFVVNWKNDGHELQTTLHPSGRRIWAHNFNLDYIFKPSVSWSDITTKGLAGRFYPEGFIFDATGLSAFYESEKSQFVGLGLLNSKFANMLSEVLNPTLHFKTGDYRRLPLPSKYEEQGIVEGVREAVAIARADWDNFETSWDFRDQPLLRPELKGATLETSWQSWAAHCAAAIRRMQELETENNRLFIDAYGLGGELQPDVPEEQVTLARAEARRDMAAFLSYAVGCMMGRYALDQPGLILANAGDTLGEYLRKVGLPQDQLAFLPDADGIIPVLDGEWFEDDVVARTRDFLRATFGEATLRENVRFLEDALGKDLRKYFLNDFYKDHLQTYKKRPIYWLVQSPRKGFSVLIYLHRYSRDTLNVVLNRYLREYQGKLRGRLAQLAQSLAGDALAARERAAARKEQERLSKVLHECEEWERDALLPLAQQRIVLDLDDGVKLNYRKLEDVLAPIPGLAGSDD